MQAPLPTPVANSMPQQQQQQQQQPQAQPLQREMVVNALKKHMMQLDCSQDEYAEKFESVSLHALSTVMAHAKKS